MSAKLEMGGIYRTEKWGDADVKTRVFIPIKEITYTGNSDIWLLNQNIGEKFIFGIEFNMNRDLTYYNSFLSISAKISGREMVSKIRNPKKVYALIFDYIFNGKIKKIEDIHGYLKL